MPGKATEGEKMDKINLYNAYQNSYYNKTNQVGKNNQSGKSTQSAASNGVKGVREVTAKENTVELSLAAKDLLKELKEKYGNTDFIIANYETDEEAASYLARGTKQYSVLLSPEELEEMAADEDKKNENLAILDDALAKLDEIKNQLGEKGEEVKRLGIAIGDNGELSFFAELEKVSEKQRERIEKNREEKKAESKEAKAEAAEEKRTEKYASDKPGKSTMVYAANTEELLEKIHAVDWESIKENEAVISGSKFDFTV